MPHSHPKEPNYFLIRKLYFLVISLVGVIGTLVSLGAIINLGLKNILITDDEIVNSSRYSYELNECNRNISLNTDTINTSKKTDKEIEICKEKKISQIVSSRSIDNKTSLIESISRGILFLILMITHLPAFLNSTKKSN